MNTRWLIWGCIALMAGCGAPAANSARSGDFTIVAGDTRIQVELDEALRDDHTRIRRWLDDGVKAMTAFYGQFPVDRLAIQVSADSRPGVQGGRTFGFQIPLIQVTVGVDTSPEQFRRDWVLVHEMVHLTFPEMPETHLWAHEGLATYIEPLARYQAGQLSARQVWGDLVEGLPKGTRELAHAGLDENSSWGSTYWGGAVFWLLADLEIRERTRARHGLQDALRAIVSKGGTNQIAWPLRDALRQGDAAIGVDVLVPLYERMRATPQGIELSNLWLRLGVSTQGNRVEFDDSAPLAALRRAIAAE